MGNGEVRMRKMNWEFRIVKGGVKAVENLECQTSLNCLLVEWLIR